VIRSWIVGVCLVLSAGRAEAGSIEMGKAAFARGKAAFERFDFEAALEEFEYTFLFATSLNATLNVATTLERLGRSHEAAAVFDRHVALLGAPTDVQQQAALQNSSAHAERDRQAAGENAAASFTAEAKRADRAARYAFDHKDWDTAAAQYLYAYLMVPNAQLVRNIAVALEAEGEYRRAAAVFDRYLELAPAATDDEEKKALEETRARADALRYKREPQAEVQPDTRAKPVAAARPGAAPEVTFNFILHGPAASDAKHKRCLAAVNKTGMKLHPVASLTAVLMIANAKNRYQIVDHENGVVHDEVLPGWGMEQLCTHVMQTTLAYGRVVPD